jgi:hypothetical protein
MFSISMSVFSFQGKLWGKEKKYVHLKDKSQGIHLFTDEKAVSVETK